LVNHNIDKQYSDFQPVGQSARQLCCNVTFSVEDGIIL